MHFESGENPAFARADLFADISCDAPLEKGHISFLRTDAPGQSPNEPMAIVQKPIVQVEIPIPDGMYIIKNRAEITYWIAGNNPMESVFFHTNSDTTQPHVQVNKHSPLAIIQVFNE